MSSIIASDSQVARLTQAIAQRVGQQRFNVWFNNSARFEMRDESLEIAVPNDFISEWIGTHFSRMISEVSSEVFGCVVPIRYNVAPEMFAAPGASDAGAPAGGSAVLSPAISRNAPRPVAAPIGAAPVVLQRPLAEPPVARRESAPVASNSLSGHSFKARLRHDLSDFIVGQGNQLAYNTACYVAEFPGAQYNPLFVHGSCGLGKTHLLQGVCREFIKHHPTKRWAYMTGEEFTNDYLQSLRNNKVDSFRRRMRDVDLLVIDDVHFLAGKKATQEEFLHTFNAIEALGKQVVMASDNHPKLIDEFGESLVNRFVSGMVVRVDPPNFVTRVEILRKIAFRQQIELSEEVINWIARRVTQNIRELEGAMTRVSALVRLSGRTVDVSLVQEALGDLDRHHDAPIKPESILQSVCDYFGIEHKDLMSGRRQRTISLARSVAMYLVRKTAHLSFPEIGIRLGKRNHSTVISACRRIERAIARNTPLAWTSSVGEREEEAIELVQRLEEHSRTCPGHATGHAAK